jgi:hypothetical protein
LRLFLCISSRLLKFESKESEEAALSSRVFQLVSYRARAILAKHLLPIYQKALDGIYASSLQTFELNSRKVIPDAKVGKKLYQVESSALASFYIRASELFEGARMPFIYAYLSS